MATRTVIDTLSDLSGEPAERTVTFAVGKIAYEIDLTDQEAREFLEVMQPYVKAARSNGRR
ncbi:Lsr2 dimerization domain-containing protein [Serinibacter salmoneus]|uniref:Lsr2 protein n=1 Tax=Serinibacter salmoneus TaxID=556530 RepID=A0A2A9D3A0_9MICO|nr:histone-like nucleoid-structuring protein Lsr2 [Serinibacter salmoneus]PFG21133.1 Lsr2 protein [Serinibacter salmoneus]